MEKYHKIQTVYKRDPNTGHKSLIIGDYSLPEFDFLKDCTWGFTEKIDGTNIRIIIQNGEVDIRGKSDNAQIPPALLKSLRQTFEPIAPELNQQFPEGACFYGEGCGAGIQKGGGNYGDPHFILFDVKVGPWYLTKDIVGELAKQFNLEMVPDYGKGTLHDMVEIVKAGVPSKLGDFQAEGLIAIPTIELQTRSGRRIITKLKCRDFDHVVGQPE